MDNLNNQSSAVELELPDEKLWDDSISLSRKEIQLPDGRSLKSELWGEFGYTFLTYTFPKDDLESKTRDEVISYLVEQGILIDPLEFSPQKIDLMTSTINPSLYNLTLTITEPGD